MVMSCTSWGSKEFSYYLCHAPDRASGGTLFNVLNIRRCIPDTYPSTQYVANNAAEGAQDKKKDARTFTLFTIYPPLYQFPLVLCGQ